MPSTNNDTSHSATQTQTTELLATIQGKSQLTPPIWLMRQAGRFLPEYRKLRQQFPDFMQLCRSPEATTELALQPLERFKLDAAIVFSDILTIPEALQLGLRFEANHGPIFDAPLTDSADVFALPFDEVIDRCDYVFRAVQHLKERLPKNLPLIGFSGSAWTLMCYMIQGHGCSQFGKTKQFLYEHPIASRELIEQLSLIIARYLAKQAQAGADILFLIDTWGGILPATLTPSILIESFQLIHEQLHHTYNCTQPLMIFTKNHHLVQHDVKAFCEAIAVDWTQNLAQVMQQQPSLCIQGNLDPHILMAGPVATQTHTLDMLQRLPQTQKNFIASLGHGILPQTPVESVHAFIDTVRSYDHLKGI